MASVAFQITQNEVKSITNPARITAIGGDNATEFNLFFPFFPPGSQWVFPFTYGFMYIVDSPSYMPVKIDASQSPPGSQTPPSTTKIAQLVAYDGNMVFNPGIVASTSILVRWILTSAPATGAQATATRAAMPGVTHICDFFHFNLIAQAGAASANPGVIVRDGVSGVGTPMFSSNAGSIASTGSQSIIQAGPGLNLRGTPGNALTVEFGAGVANYVEVVDSTGYDQ